MIEVIAFTLQYLKYEFHTQLTQQCSDLNLKASDFKWVITVPAMWKARGRQMMREAAYMVIAKVFIYSCRDLSHVNCASVM